MFIHFYGRNLRLCLFLCLFVPVLLFSCSPAFAVARPDRSPDKKEKVTQNGIIYECELWNNITQRICLATVVGTEDKDITSLSIPQSVELNGEVVDYTVYRIGRSAFAGYENLTSVSLHKFISIIQESAFANCTSLNYISFDGNLVTIGNNAFENCSSLVSISLPKSLNSIGGSSPYTGGDTYAAGYIANPFKGCTKLSAINVESGNSYFFSFQGALYNSDISELYICPEGLTPRLPESLKTIGVQAFYNNEKITKVDFPSSLEEIKDAAFCGCSNLSDVSFPEGLAGIGNSAFMLCKSLTSVDLPGSVKRLGEQAFAGCTMLSEVKLPENLQSLRYRTFAGTALSSIQLPASLTSLGGEVFYGCTFETLTIPDKVEYLYTEKSENNRSYWYYPFDGFTCKIIYILTDINPAKTTLYTKGLNSDCIIFAYKNTLEHTEFYVGSHDSSGWGNGYSFDELFSLESYGPYLTAIAFNLKKITAPIPANIAIGNVSYNGFDITPDKDGTFVIEDLAPGRTYSGISYTIDLPDASANIKFALGPIATRTVTGTSDVTTTQTKAVFSNVNIALDKYTMDYEIGVYLSGKAYPYTNRLIEINDLKINTSYSYNYYISEDNKVYLSEKDGYFKTEGISMSLTATESPTSIEIETSVDTGEVKMVSSSLKIGSNVLDFTNGVVTGLDPDSSYALTLIVNTSNGSQSYNKTVKTIPLELKTLKPKCVSETCAIVAAETNISDIEPSVGFEWKKYDAPASMPASEGYGAVCDGMLEGYIKNLQSTSFYNVRPFYKNAAGKYYYGDWITFDPSDFSYFEPTVRTYPVQNVTQTSATVRGYVMPGTENIKRQGFQYWQTGGRKVRANAPSGSDIITVDGSGQVMTITFDDLEPGTDYAFRVFVETDAGYTYGDEQKFTTEGVASIEDITDGSLFPKVVGYFNMMGVKSDKPHKGVNIVVYSDGTSKKMMK